VSTVKTLLLFVLSGALLGVLVASLIAPGAYVWYESPGSGRSQELLVREDVIRATTDHLLHSQAIGAGVGALAFLVLGILLVRAQSRRAARLASTTGTRPSGASDTGVPPPTTPTTPAP
jgi:hypothetical protein